MHACLHRTGAPHDSPLKLEGQSPWDFALITPGKARRCLFYIIFVGCGCFLCGRRWAGDKQPIPGLWCPCEDIIDKQHLDFWCPAKEPVEAMPSSDVNTFKSTISMHCCTNPNGKQPSDFEIPLKQSRPLLALAPRLLVCSRTCCPPLAGCAPATSAHPSAGFPAQESESRLVSPHLWHKSGTVSITQLARPGLSSECMSKDCTRIQNDSCERWKQQS